MRSFCNVWFSKRRAIYMRIARKCHSTPWKVYCLARGGVIKSDKDMKILHMLQDEGIISHINPW